MSLRKNQEMPTAKPNLIDRSNVDALLLAAAPEREDDLRALWAAYEPGFAIAEDRKGLVFRASKDRITFSHKTLRHDWVLAFAASAPEHDEHTAIRIQ